MFFIERLIYYVWALPWIFIYQFYNNTRNKKNHQRVNYTIKTLYEDFSKKVDLSNGLPTNSTLDKDKNGPYMIDISFYSPILDIIYLYNDEFPVY